MNQLYNNFCNLIGWMIFISGYKRTLVRFYLRSDESEKRHLSVVLFRLSFGCKLEKMSCSITSSDHLREANG